MLQKIKNLILNHLIITGLVIVIIVGGTYYLLKSKTTTEVRYVTATVAKGNIISTVTGTGQVEASSSIDVKAKVSGEITALNIKPGDYVARGKVLARLDSTEAQKSVRDAEINLANAKLALEKLKITYSNDNLNANLEKVYDESFSTVSSVFADLSPTMVGLENVLNTSNLSFNDIRNSGDKATNLRNKAEESFYKVEAALIKNTKNFSAINRNSSQVEIESLINETSLTVSLLSEAIKNTKDLVNYIQTDTDRPSDFSTTASTLTTYATTIDNDLANLASAKTNIADNKDNYLNNNLDIQSSLLSLEQKKNSLLDAKNNLADYTVVAPISGVVSALAVELGDTASGSIATIITKQKIATISLNEVDIAKIKLDQKVTLTFDAIESLTITGKVAEIDSIGTVSSGVVSYNVNISFDVENDKIKPGMSVSAIIMTETALDVLAIPNGAIKTKNGATYVQTFMEALPESDSGVGATSTTLPKQVNVEVGLVDDTATQIISGLKEGDIIVIKTITGTTTSTSSSTKTPSILNAVSGGGPRN